MNPLFFFVWLTPEAHRQNRRTNEEKKTFRIENEKHRCTVYSKLSILSLTKDGLNTLGSLKYIFQASRPLHRGEPNHLLVEKTFF